MLAPAWGIGAESRLRRALSPALIRAGALLCGDTLRLDVRPSDVEHTGHMLALEWVLSRCGGHHHAVTLEEALLARR